MSRELAAMPGIAATKSRLVLNFAVAALRSGDVMEAQRLLRERLFEAPGDSDALAKLAEIAVDQRRIEEATVLLRQAANAECAPERRMILVDHLQTHVGAAAALKEIESFPPALRNSFDARAKEAALLGIIGVHDRQIELYKQLASDFPSNPALWMTLGNALKTVGRFDEAVAALRRAIEIRPTYGEAYWTLANFKAFRFEDGDLAAMRKALRQKLRDDEALHFHFALGKALEDRQRFAQSFKHYREGNRLRAREFGPEQMSATAFVDAATATFTSELSERHAGSGCRADDPIFVVGLNRSGSTLIEQILASHPSIEGTTELPVMQQVWGRLIRAAASSGRNAFQAIAEMETERLEEIGAEYLERARPFRMTDRPYFVDKQPANWMHIGLIRLALPNASIIDARRHPMACGFSNFKQNYASGIAFSYSQESIGRFYRDYCRFMAHIDHVQPGAVHRVINEHLIDRPDAEIRRMLGFIGVPFDRACLEFHLNSRAVRTPSSEQVRRPINRDGTNYWRHYEPWLGPMKQALGPALEQWDWPPETVHPKS